MAYNPKTWGNKEKITSSGLNQCKDSLDFLYSRFIPSVVASCVAETNLCVYVCHFNEIDPTQSGGSGTDGATWTKAWAYENGLGLVLGWPSGMFSAAPYVIGHSVESNGTAWGITVQSFWNLSTTGCAMALRDSGGPQYAITSKFGLTVVLLGIRAGTVT